MAQAFVGKPAPNFTTEAVINGDFKTISLSDFKGKYVVLFFYPLDLYVFIIFCFAIFYKIYRKF